MRIISARLYNMEDGKPNGRARKWRLCVNTEEAGRRFRRFTGTYSAAQKALDEFKAELEGLIPNGETFSGYALARVAERANSGNIMPNTIGTEMRYARALGRSPMGKMRMDAIKPTDCRASLAWVRENPQRPDLAKGDVLSNTSMQGIYRFCRATFQQAVDDELLAKNPMAKIKDPKADTPEVEALPWDKMMALLDFLDTLPISAFVMAVYMIACLALRRSEACGILDAEAWPTLIHVSSAVKEKTGVLGPPKSEAGERDLPVMPRLSAKMGEWRAHKASKGLDGSLTFACNVQGGVLMPQNLYRWWKLVTKGTEFDGVGLHQLRHSNLTRMARHMGAFDLMSYAGWSSLKPARIYIHDDYEMVHTGVCNAWGVEPRDLIRKAA